MAKTLAINVVFESLAMVAAKCTQAANGAWDC